MDIRGPLNNPALTGDVSHTQRHLKSHPVEDVKKSHLAGKASVPTAPTATALSRLTTELRRVPEVREELISQVSKRLTAGHYFTRAAAEETAAAITKGFEISR